MSIEASNKAPWHLWAVAAVGILWNAYGAFDYFMTKTKGAAYMREVGMTDTQISYLNTWPAWMTAVWAIGVWGALLGSILLLIRSKWAVETFTASLVSFVISLIYGYGISPMPDAGAMIMTMQAIILAGCLFFVWYASLARKARNLR